MSRRSLSDYQQDWPLASRIERQLHRMMDVLIGNSQAVVRDLLREGVPSSKIRLIYNGVSVPNFVPNRKAARRSLNLDDDMLVGVMVANLLPYKGHRDLIRALSSVEPYLSFSWCILLVGKDTGLRSELEVLAAELGVGHRLRFLGEQRDVAEILAAADFALLTPSGNEGFSNAILEAMVTCLPVIVTDVGGNAEAVVDGETGFVVPSGDVEALSGAIRRLACEPELRARLGRAALRRVEANFSLKRSVDAHLEVYQELLEKRKAETRS
jgi:glycosyltransferase involved in cell wall biosynthesis